MIRILFFLPSFTGGGAERTLINIANGLNRKEYIVHFVIIDRPVNGKYKDEYYDFLREDIIVHNLNIRILKRNYAKIVLKISKTIKSVKPDIVMSTMLRSNIMLTSAVKIGRHKCKIVLRESNNRSATTKKWIEKEAITFIYGKVADMTVALSKGVKKDLCEHFGVKSKKIQVIYNPIDLEGITQLAKEDVKLQGNNIIVTAGRFHKQKNYPIMIKALSLLKESIDFHMYILGKGELENEIKQQICDEGLMDRVTMVGFQANPYKFFSRSKVFVLTSDWEGFGHVIVEAMTCGTAVISTDCPYGPNEIITNHENGILVPIGDYRKLSQEIGALLLDDSKRKRIIENGKKRAQDFSMKRIVREYETLFKRIIKTTNT